MRHKIIGIDARLMYQTGVGVYVRNLISNLATLDTPGLHFRIYARKEDIARLRLQDTKMYRIKKITFVRCDVGWHSFAEQIFFFFQLWRDNLDLVHFPYFSWPILYRRPFCVTIHDTILLTHTTGNASTKWYAWYRIKHAVFCFVLSEQVRRSKIIIVPSHTVKREVEAFYPNARNKIRVIAEGVDSGFLSSQPQPVYELENRRFFLYVGNCYPHKNVETLLHAFEIIAKEDIHIKLCIVGPDNFFLQRLKKQGRAKSSTLYLHNISAAELKWLYSNAKALVFPSLAEGFGLPIVEAMNCKCPLILSDIPVFHEVAGDCATYFSPTRIEELVNRMREVRKRENAFAINPTFTFKHMTKKIITIYNELTTK